MTKLNTLAAFTTVMTMAAVGLSAGWHSAANTTVKSETLIVSGDSVSATQGCILTGQYPRGSLIVFRAQVRTPAGKPAAPSDKVVVHLSNGMQLRMMDIHHPLPGKPMYWVATWLVPMNAKLGTLSYTITALNPHNGVHGTFYPFPTPTTLPTIVPFTYNAKVTATAGGKVASLITVGSTLKLVAAIDQDVPAGKSFKAIPLTHGVVKAQLGLAGATTPGGGLKAALSINLRYDATTKTWVGTTLLASGLPQGLYEIEVKGHDSLGNLVSSTPIWLGLEG